MKLTGKSVRWIGAFFYIGGFYFAIDRGAHKHTVIALATIGVFLLICTRSPYETIAQIVRILFKGKRPVSRIKNRKMFLRKPSALGPTSNHIISCSPLLIDDIIRAFRNEFPGIVSEKGTLKWEGADSTMNVTYSAVDSPYTLFVKVCCKYHESIELLMISKITKIASTLKCDIFSESD